MGDTLLFNSQTNLIDSIRVTSENSVVSQLYYVKLETSVARPSLTVRFMVPSDATPVPDQPVLYNTSATVPTMPTRPYDNFVAWTLNGSVYNFSNIVTEDVVLEATWTKKKFTVRFDVNGGDKSMSPVIVDAQTTLGTVAPPQSKYGVFLGWKNFQGVSVDPATLVVQSDTMLVAQWRLENYVSDHTYNVDIVYIYPYEREPMEGYRQRISENLFKCQNYYRKELKRLLGKDMTFGLQVGESSGEVKIYTIHGKNPEIFYSRDINNGAQGDQKLIVEEVKQYFKDNNIPYGSTHTIILIPDYYSSLGQKQPYSLPYNGYDDWAIFSEGPITSLSGYWTDQSNNELYGKSGFIHELGHGFRLPHSNFSYELEDGKIAYTIMNSGYFKFKEQGNNVFFTQAEAYILDRTDVFPTGGIPSYNLRPNYVTFESMEINSDASKLYLKAKINSDAQIKYAIIYQDGDYPKRIRGEATDKGYWGDYDQVVWAQEFDAVNKTINFTMPYTELWQPIDVLLANDITHTIKIYLVCENGYIYKNENLASYKFANKKADINIKINDGSQYTFYTDRNIWKIIDMDKLTGNEGSNMIDGNLTTFWESQWWNNSLDYPYSFVLDLGSTREVKGLAFQQRQRGTGSIGSFDVESSTDKTNWVAVGSFGLTKDGFYRQFKDFPQVQNARYFRLKIKTPAVAGDKHANLAEIEPYN